MLGWGSPHLPPSLVRVWTFSASQVEDSWPVRFPRGALLPHAITKSYTLWPVVVNSQLLFESSLAFHVASKPVYLKSPHSQGRGAGEATWTLRPKSGGCVYLSTYERA